MTLLEPLRAGTAPAFATDLARHGDRVAVTTGARSITFAELDQRATDIARRLGDQRRLVLLAARNTVDALTAYLGALRGGHPVLLAPTDPSAIRSLARAYDPDVVLSDGDIDERRLGTAHALHPDLALLLSTSGSTGSPKLVRLSRENLDANASAIATSLGLTTADRAITTLPMQYCYGLSVINSHLHAGASLALTDLSVVDPCFWALFEAARATSFAGVPHTFDLLDRIGFADMALPTLRYVTQAGGRMHPDVVRRYAELGARAGWDLVVMYGQTEATARMAYLPPALASSHPHTIGVPIPGGAFTLAAPDGGAVPDGRVGELVYRGANVMLGYAERPRDLALGRVVDALHTGDLARRTPEGLYEVVGRCSRFVKPFGLRIDLDRVEQLLHDHDIAATCAGDDRGLVVALERGDDADRAASVVTDDAGLPRGHVRVVVGPVSRLANGKPDYATIVERARDTRDIVTGDVRGDGTMHTATTATSSTTATSLTTATASTTASAPVAAPPAPPAAPSHRETVRDAFADVLGIDGTDAGDDESFVSLGGDSLSYVEMSIRLEAILGALPRDWHTTPLGRLAPARPRSQRPRAFLAATDTTAVLRAVAIVLIVGTHADLWHLPGGAHTLLAVAGYNFARFAAGAAATLASIGRIAVPSMCWIGLVAAVSDKYGWPNVLLVHGLVGRPGDHWGYWFVEALVLILVPVAALLAVPAVARLDRRRPLALPSLALVAGLLVRFDVVDLGGSYQTARPLEVLWLFALGWYAARATTSPHRLTASVLAAVAVWGFFGDTHRELLILAGVLLVIWVPTLPLPRVAHRAVAPVASASLYIYLTHWQVYPPLSRLHSAALAVVGSVVVGIAAWWVAAPLVDRVGRAVTRVARARPCC